MPNKSQTAKGRAFAKKARATPADNGNRQAIR
jgi:hypothetical protein